MAKRRPRPNVHALNRLRDAHRIASGRLSSLIDDVDEPLTVLEPPRLRINPPSVRSNPLLEVEDRRRWQPPGAVRRARSSRRWNVPLKLSATRPSSLLKRRSWPTSPAHKAVARNVSLGGLSFRAPRFVAICVRRKSRKEVLHALGKVGKGSSRVRRRNSYSNVRC